MKAAFGNQAAEFVYVRTYARWMEEKGRRETWEETVDRYVTFIKEERGEKIPEKVLRKIREKMLAFEVVPSMRALHAAGEAARIDNTTIFNCSFSAVDHQDAFAEALYILMCGTGYGFSVEKRYVEKLPVVPVMTSASMGTFVIEDSRRGWADSVKALVNALYAGADQAMDYSKIRPLGARLKTMGGRASGPAPLIKLHEFMRTVFSKAQGRKLTSLEVHDVMNMIAEVVVVGGVRRSSQISLSDLDDQAMRDAKTGSYPYYRGMANNSAVYHEKPDMIQFMREWTALAASGTGERGIFNLTAVEKCAPRRRNTDLIIGSNPCGEIQLRSRQFCNLSEIVARPDDDVDSLLDKVETATWIGVIQSTFTHFPYLSEEWRKNCEEERLLGVSITGQMDAWNLLTPQVLQAMKSRYLKVMRKACKIMGVPVSAAGTCGKPSGTASQVLSCPSGAHPWYAPYFLRRYRLDASDPLLKLLRTAGVEVSPENNQRKSDWAKAAKADAEGRADDVLKYCKIYRRGEEWSEDKVLTWVVAFPVKAPEGAITRKDVSVIDQLEHYKKMQTNWCEHNQSITVYVKPEEWLKAGTWVYENWDIVNGISFLPEDGGVYEQMPYEEITKDAYEIATGEFPQIDFGSLALFERDDQTTGSKEFACVSGACEI